MGQNVTHQGVGGGQPRDLPANVRDYVNLRRAAAKHDPFDPASLAQSRLCGHCLDLIATVLEGLWCPGKRHSTKRPSRSVRRAWETSRRGAESVDYGGLLRRHPVRPDNCRLCRHLVEERGMIPVTRRGKTFVVLEEIDAGQLRLRSDSMGEGPRDWMRISVDEPWPEYEAHLSQRPDGQWPSKLVRRHGLEAGNALHDPKAWLSQCLEHHKRCRQDPVGVTNGLPTRVIDVGRHGDAQELRLHIPGDETGSYIALSHCWGPEGSLTTKTLSSNLEEHCRSLNFDTLPRTFQDAVTITRALGLRYLWIDALCIVQDSADDLDWKREASRMDSVYSDATAVIVAAAGPDSHAGMLARPTEVDVLEVPTLSLDAAMGAPFTGKLPLGIPLREADGFGPALLASNPASKHHWRSRGWTLQEEALARRLIYFTESQCFWVCKEGFRSQAGHSFEVYDDSGLNLAILQSQNLAVWELMMKGGLDERIPGPESHVDPISRCYDWHSLVQMYTSRELTRVSDRMKAIEGLATRYFGHSYQELYVYGVSKADLGRSLAWRSTHPRLRQVLTEPDVLFSLPELRSLAPSWSWGSVQGGVSWYWDAPEDIKFLSYEKISKYGAGLTSLPDDFIDRYWPPVPRDWHLPVKGFVLNLVGPGSLENIPDLWVTSSTTETKPTTITNALLLFLYSEVVQPPTGRSAINIRSGKLEGMTNRTPVTHTERLYNFLQVENVEPGYDVYRRVGTCQLRWLKRGEDLMSPYLREMSLILV